MSALSFILRTTYCIWVKYVMEDTLTVVTTIHFE